MAITYDPAKRERTLRERGLDFEDARLIFSGNATNADDIRKDYGETRYLTAGFLHGRMIVVVWTPRGNDRHIISMRPCHAKEQRKWLAAMGRPG